MTKGRIAIIVGALLGIVAVVVVIMSIMSTVREREEEIEYLNAEIEDLVWQVAVFGDVINVYTLAQTRRSGTMFDANDVTMIQIPSLYMNNQYITDLSILHNTIYRIDVEPGMPLMRGLFFREALTQTDRLYDTVVDVYPIGIKPGDFVDLRIVTPQGLDYIVLAKKRVIEFYTHATRFILSEEEIHQYQSCLVDAFLNPGTYLYMTTYVEPALQRRANVYYPVNDVILALIEVNPNIVQLAETDLIRRQRRAYERALEVDRDFQDAIISGRSAQLGKLIDAARIVGNGGANAVNPEDGSGTGSMAQSGSGNLLGNQNWGDRTQQQMQFDGTSNIAPSDWQQSGAPINTSGGGW